MDLSLNYRGDKGFRLLNIYERLNKGETIYKSDLANEFGVSLKTIQRDIDDLRTYLIETHFEEIEVSIRYDKSKNGYYLIRDNREHLTNEEIVSLCKILLESRAFNKKELSLLIEKILAQSAPNDKKIIREIIASEYLNYVSPKHNKPLFREIWHISQAIFSKHIITFTYERQDKKISDKVIKPVALLFSEFYFYLIGFSSGDSTDYPFIFRIDRMRNITVTNKTFDIPYKDRFQDGEFRKRVQFMYAGPLKTVRFEYSGVLEAILDRLPTAEILQEKDGIYTISAETYGDGIYMWLRSQGDLVKILS